MSYKFIDLIQRATLRLSQQTGTAVQVYSEDIIAEMMQHKFDILFEERWWEDYTLWTQGTLLASGIVQEDLADAGVGIDRYTDINCIFYNNDTNPLPRVTDKTNPRRFQTGGASRPTLHEPWGAAGKFFRVLPYGSLSTVQIRYRQRPATFVADSDIKMDDHLMILGTCYDYLEDDGTNPAATAKFLNLYNSRLEQITASYNEQPIPLNDGYHPGGSSWGVGDVMP